MPMPPADDEFTALFARAKDGCPDAVSALFVRYAPHVREVARRRLALRLRTRLDSVDCTQDVWLSFLKTSVERLDFPNERAFLGYLSQMAVNKIGEEHRRRAAMKNDFLREQPLAGDNEPPARQASPSQIAVADEQWDGLIGRVPGAQREILEMLRDGYTHAEIGQRLVVHKKTVQRLPQRLKSRQ